MNALLSLVLSMGNNRVAGSLRFGEERDRPSGDEELEVTVVFFQTSVLGVELNAVFLFVHV